MQFREISTNIEDIEGHAFEMRAALYSPDKESSDIVFMCLPGGGVTRELF